MSYQLPPNIVLSSHPVEIVLCLSLEPLNPPTGMLLLGYAAYAISPVLTMLYSSGKTPNKRSLPSDDSDGVV